ncbi:MAG TPA: ABC transporter ATP-binding protein [Anaerolineaceae bacterium]
MEAQTTPIIETRELKKIYGEGENEVVALGGIDLVIYAGEFVAIMGPSGSGKSTLLNILACLDQPTDGAYILAGENVSEYSHTELAFIRSRQLGFIFQSYNLLPRLSAVDNVMMPMMYRRDEHTGHAERKERAMAALEQVGLASRAHHMPNQLSGGQQQRVAIARALINDPLLILADEPTGNLDTHASRDIMDLLGGLHDRGRTIVMVTHEPDIAHYTQRILTIRDGHLASDKMNGKRPTPAAEPASAPEARE